MEAVTLYQVLCYFLIYSVIGWVVEVVFHALNEGRIINRGFLNGPLCPIYGFGVVSILLLLRMMSRNHPEVFHAAGIFFIGTILATAIELFGGWILDKAFHARWWDYRDRRFNLNGYICPQFSLMWGCGILIVVRIIHPFIRDTVMLPSEKLGSWIIVAALYLVLLTDLVTSVLIMIGLNTKFAELDEMQRKLRIISDRASVRIGEDTLKGAEKIEHIRQEAGLHRTEFRDRIDEKREDLIGKTTELETKYEKQKKEVFDAIKAHRSWGAGRVFFGNPTFAHRDFSKYIKEIKELYDEKRRED